MSVWKDLMLELECAERDVIDAAQRQAKVTLEYEYRVANAQSRLANAREKIKRALDLTPSSPPVPADEQGEET